MPAYLPACLLAIMHAIVHACMHACLLDCMLALPRMPDCMHGRLSDCLLACLAACLRASAALVSSAFRTSAWAIFANSAVSLGDGCAGCRSTCDLRACRDGCGFGGSADCLVALTSVFSWD